MIYIHTKIFIFLILCCAFSIWENIKPAYPSTQPRSLRWFVNLSLATCNSTIAQLLPLLPPFLLAQSSYNSFGILKNIQFPEVLAIIITVISLDFIIYWQHRFFHKIPWLWTWHRVHHEDQDLDLSSGIRFHPIEMILSTLIKSAAVLCLGAHPLGIFIAEVILSSAAIFQHSNISIGRWDYPLQKILVTPCMHRIHHSIPIKMTDSNFSFSISLWDHLFKTYHSPVTTSFMPLGTQKSRRNTPYSVRECFFIKF
ncbi:MAG: sterol desaturase family protein [Oligoflexales bacterium]